MNASIYDGVMAPFERMGLRRLRRRIAGMARGTVLEIGVGTGLTLAEYGDAREVIGLEPDLRMLARARSRARRSGSNRPVSLLSGRGEVIPFAGETFDTVVSTFTLCTVADPDAMLRECRRVLKPDGTLLLLEHVRGPSPARARWLARITPAWSRIAGGCRLDRDTEATAIEAGFRITSIEHRLGGHLILVAAKPE